MANLLLLSVSFDMILFLLSLHFPIYKPSTFPISHRIYNRFLLLQLDLALRGPNIILVVLDRLPFSTKLPLGIRLLLHFFFSLSILNIYSILFNELLAAVTPFLPSSSGMPGKWDSRSKSTAAPHVLVEPFPERETEVTAGNPTIPRAAGDEAGPSQQPGVRPNTSWESSIRNRILKLEAEGSIFLPDKGEYWANLKQALNKAPSQSEYTRILEFENRDLQIREQKLLCYGIFQQVLSEHPDLVDKAYYNPQEAFIDLFFEERDKLDAKDPYPWSPAEIDREELRFLDTVERDLREHGPKSIYISNNKKKKKYHELGTFKYSFYDVRDEGW